LHRVATIKNPDGVFRVLRFSALYEFTVSLYAIGIDLGTSHTVVASVALDGATSDIAARYSAAQHGRRGRGPAAAAFGALPGGKGRAGRGLAAALAAAGRGCSGACRHRPLGARSGAAVPGRLVASAKSWLSHTGVDRTAAILPWGAGEDVAKVSPLAASSSYLAHVRAAWDQAHPEAPLHQQSVVLTVPASFDEGARALTLEAAQMAGLPRVQLLEEPKAAFHDWLVLQGDELAAQLADSRLVLVVDVGGELPI
jgi:molecular chaperone DnaK (HSP70)